MPTFHIDAIPTHLLNVRHLLEPAEAAACAVCEEEAVQEVTARGLTVKLYLCFQHALVIAQA